MVRSMANLLTIKMPKNLFKHLKLMGIMVGGNIASQVKDQKTYQHIQIKFTEMNGMVGQTGRANLKSSKVVKKPSTL